MDHVWLRSKPVDNPGPGSRVEILGYPFFIVIKIWTEGYPAPHAWALAECPGLPKEKRTGWILKFDPATNTFLL